MVHQTVQELVKKSSENVLNEFEIQMYEAMSRMLTTHARFLDAAYRCQLMETEQKEAEMKKDHKIWSENQKDDEDEDGEAVSS